MLQWQTRWKSPPYDPRNAGRLFPPDLRDRLLNKSANVIMRLVDGIALTSQGRYGETLVCAFCPCQKRLFSVGSRK